MHSRKPEPSGRPTPAEIARIVPDYGWAAVALWSDELPPRFLKIRAEQRLVVGRAPENLEGNELPLVLTQRDKPLISRKHLVVSVNLDAGWQIGHPPGVGHPGWVRHWGDLNWRDADVAAVSLRNGLIAYLFPGRHRYILTVAAPPLVLKVNRKITPKEDYRTADPEPPIRIGVTDLQRTMLTDVLLDAVRWPPAATDGRILGWKQVAEPIHDSDSPRANYRRLRDNAEACAELNWRSGTRGVDPSLLRKLIETGEIQYADVYRQRGEWPTGELMPTHHTHSAKGHRKDR